LFERPELPVIAAINASRAESNFASRFTVQYNAQGRLPASASAGPVLLRGALAEMRESATGEWPLLVAFRGCKPSKARKLEHLHGATPRTGPNARVWRRIAASEFVDLGRHKAGSKPWRRFISWAPVLSGTAFLRQSQKPVGFQAALAPKAKGVIGEEVAAPATCPPGR